MKHFNNPIGLLLLLTTALLICLIIVNTFFFIWNWGTMKYQNSDDAKPQPIVNVEVKEKLNCVKCEICPPCTYENVEAIPLEKE